VFAGFIGSVVSVFDGDTIEVLHNTNPERVRHYWKDDNQTPLFRPRPIPSSATATVTSTTGLIAQTTAKLGHRTE